MPQIDVKPLALIRVVLVTLAIGWLFVLVVALILVRIQTNEIAWNFPPARFNSPFVNPLRMVNISQAISKRLDQELSHSAVLLLSQIGVLCGVLTWQFGHTGTKRSRTPIVQGFLCGTLVAAIQTVIALAWGVTIQFYSVAALVLILVGLYSGWAEAEDAPKPSTT